MQQHQRAKAQKMDRKPVPGSFPGPPTPPDSDGEVQKRPILLSNESPILAINRSSINRLNKEIEKSGGKLASGSVFRGSCRRCHMICVDQDTAEKNEEPFVTLAKTRRFESKVFFGSHMSHVPSSLPYKEHQFPVIKVGDKVSVG
ncbi:molybdenum cofactor sulfurase protein [Rutstroemia sp. NJR-2017a BBW]|nr:molybdenum cofactor sulfurase protein [Rutstroemia sp. NJR-2017a BBW]